MQFKAAALVLAGLSGVVASPWRSLQGLGAKSTPDYIDPSTGHKYFSHSYTHEHPDYGLTTLSYTAVVPPHVVFLDDLPFLSDLSCTSDSLDLHLDSSSSPSSDSSESSSSALSAFLSSLVPGTVLVGSSDFGCHTSLDSGLVHGRHLSDDGTGGHAVYRQVLSSPSSIAVLASTTPTTAAGPSRLPPLTLSTSTVGPESAFVETDVKFKWYPPFHGDADGPLGAAEKRATLAEEQVARRAAIKSDLEARGLLDVDSLIKACQQQSKLEWDGDAALICKLEEDE